jgi:hypothetical protein
MRDVELFDEAVEHHVAPALPGFFEELWREAERRQRIAARRWRRVALVLAVAAAAATTAAGVLASSRAPLSATIDQTWSCATAHLGGANRVEWRTSVTTPSTDAYFFFTPQPQAATQNLGPPALRLDTHPGKVTWDPQRCVRSHTPVALTSKGLKPEIVVTTHFVGYTTSGCRSSARILLHARVTVSRGEPVHAKIAVVNAGSHRPIGYVDWSPTRIATWTSKCTSY